MDDAVKFIGCTDDVDVYEVALVCGLAARADVSKPVRVTSGGGPGFYLTQQDARDLAEYLSLAVGVLDEDEDDDHE